MTPMIVCAVPLISTLRPMIRGLDSYRVVHSMWLMSATPAAFGWSSLSRKSRPRIGRTPSSRNMSHATRAPA